MRPSLFIAIVMLTFYLVFSVPPAQAGCGPLGCAGAGVKFVGGKVRGGLGKVLGVQRRANRRSQRS